jgi:phosphoribosylamine--glycine ligase
MRVLIVGSGAREHALTWKLSRAEGVEELYAAPGNPGMAALAHCVPIGADNVVELADFAASLKMDFTVVGPELPLVLGIVDEFDRRGLPIVGPSKQAAQLEGSKVFAKEFLLRHGIPTASVYGIYDSAGDAYSALCAVDWPMVIKADGLAAGKGVLVAGSPDDATAFIDRLMVDREFGAAGDRVLLEEALAGPELSYIVLTDGEHFVPLAPSRDHKRALDGNKGPNTGGMGAYSSDTLLPRETERAILESVVQPTIAAIKKEGLRYRGFLYFGLMLTADGPKVLEFNCRMGDPETQPLVARMDFDLAAALRALAAGNLGAVRPAWKPGASICVVMAAAGYPGKPQTGARIDGLAEAGRVPGVVVFHAATQRTGDSITVAGGRVLGVTATGSDLASVARVCYEAVGKIRFDGAHFRRDIGAADPAVTAAAGE